MHSVQTLFFATLFLLLFSQCYGQGQRQAEATGAAPEKTINGFAIRDPLIPADQIKHGGPPRDGIPPIYEPRFRPAASHREYQDHERVLGVAYNGVAKAYPIGILNYHEVVNDQFAGKPVTLSYCPLCGSGAAFSRQVEGRKLTFGVSGLLYNSDVLLWDRETESLWSQIRMQAVNGPMKGTELDYIPTANTTLGQWKAQHPETEILLQPKGSTRDYHGSPYGNYAKKQGLMFPVAKRDQRLHPKARVFGVPGENPVAFPFEELEKAQGPITYEHQGETWTLEYDAKAKSVVRAENSQGKVLNGLTLYWFAWYTFHPKTKLWRYN